MLCTIRVINSRSGSVCPSSWKNPAIPHMSEIPCLVQRLWSAAFGRCRADGRLSACSTATSRLSYVTVVGLSRENVDCRGLRPPVAASHRFAVGCSTAHHSRAGFRATRPTAQDQAVSRWVGSSTTRWPEFRPGTSSLTPIIAWLFRCVFELVLRQLKAYFLSQTVEARILTNDDCEFDGKNRRHLSNSF
jgi:hypothetical protein